MKLAGKVNELAKKIGVENAQMIPDFSRCKFTRKGDALTNF